MPLLCRWPLPRRCANLQRGRLHTTWALALLLGAILGAVLGGAAVWWTQPAKAERSGPGASAPSGPRGGPGGPGGAGGGAGGAQPVSVGWVQRQDVRVLVSALGTMQARATAVVRPKVSGELQALYFKEGEEVKAGQVLAQIDPRSYRAALDQARGNLQRNQALLHNAQLDLKRYQELWAQDSTTGQQVDTQAAQVRQYEGAVQADQALLDAAQLQWSHTRVIAPIAGRLGLRQADRGNIVNASDANGLVTITQVRPIDVVFSVPEVHLAALRQRSRAALTVELWDRDNQHLLARGQLSALDNAIDTGSGTIKAKAAFANTDGALYPNQFVNVKLQIDTQDHALTVPSAALQNQWLYVVQDDGTVRQQRVRVGAVEGERTAVQAMDGEALLLREGQRVVTDGIDRLRDKAKVKIIAPPSGTPAP